MALHKPYVGTALLYSVRHHEWQLIMLMTRTQFLVNHLIQSDNLIIAHQILCRGALADLAPRPHLQRGKKGLGYCS